MAKTQMYEVKILDDEPQERWKLATGDELTGGQLAFALVGAEDKGIVSKDFWREVVEGTSFTCPKCSSHEWGTWGLLGENATGHCYGHGSETRLMPGELPGPPPRPCDFTWLRAEDDKVFTGTGIYSPAIVTAVVVAKPPLVE